MLASEVATRTCQAFRDRADHVDPDDWSTDQGYHEYVAVLRSGTAWVIGPRCVVATVADTADGRLWHYVASEGLDSAGQDLPETAFIEQLSPVSWQLTW